MKMNLKVNSKYLAKAIIAFAFIFTTALSTPFITTVHASPPPWSFGASPSSQAVHIDESRLADILGISVDASNQISQRHFSPSVSRSAYNEGELIGTLHVERLNRTVSIYEGETMRNMDFGAGRFTFSGLHDGNMALIGHNRGPAGFFSFVRLLQQGDIIIVETNQGMCRYVVEMTYIISEDDFSPLLCFNDNRLTLITCVEL
ncbi:MAG: sortase [Defluviitaleaceae bacterium]|nr:sortase [Defluviitaleaceae bacterium]